jgi:hypothetical protein
LAVGDARWPTFSPLFQHRSGPMALATRAVRYAEWVRTTSGVRFPLPIPATPQREGLMVRILLVEDDDAIAQVVGELDVAAIILKPFDGTELLGVITHQSVVRAPVCSGV